MGIEQIAQGAEDTASLYDTVKALYSQATAPVGQGSGVGMDQDGLNKYNQGARAMGVPQLTMEQWAAAGKPLTP